MGFEILLGSNEHAKVLDNARVTAGALLTQRSCILLDSGNTFQGSSTFQFSVIP